MSSSETELSVVIPVYNENALFPELLKRVGKAVEQTGLDAEIIFVDDGSTDGTADMIRAAASMDRRLKYVAFSRNFGHQIAVSAGIEHACGRAVIVMDGDLQDPPEILPRFLEKHREGWDVVYAVRQKRKEPVLLKLCYFVFYRILQKISDVQIPVDSGDFCLMDRKVVDVLNRMPERNRFVRGIRAWAGFRQTALPYERDRRFAGKAKYSLRRLIKLALDGITSFSKFPLRVCGYLGYSMAFLSLLGIGYSMFSKIFFDRTPQGWTSVTMAIFFIGGVQLVMLSVVGNYVGRVYTEVQGRPLYIVRETNILPREQK